MTFRLKAYSICEIGRREKQEDSLYPAVPLDGSPLEGSLFILCDGLGGHLDGEVASQTVCEAMSDYILAHQPFSEDVFSGALDAAYEALDRCDTGSAGGRTMGTTLTLAVFYSEGCWVAHIGDSRVYQIRPSEKRILFVTQDHSLVNDLVKMGEMTPEEARVPGVTSTVPSSALRKRRSCSFL